MDRSLLIMGVSGSGKTTITKILSEYMDIPFIEADDYHSSDNIKKMLSKQPLTDSDRLPWIYKIGSEIKKYRKKSGCCIACSALKKTYRNLIRLADGDLIVIYLKGDKRLIYNRLVNRRGHFFNAELLNSQLGILEEPDSNEDRIIVSIDASPKRICEEIIQKLEDR